MEPIIIYTDTAHVDKGAIRSFSLDMAFGADEQNFVLECSGAGFTGGEFVYIDGTEYGGVIDQYTQSTVSDVVSYTGRTWHGMLAGKVLVPAAGDDYYTVSGDANACIRAVLTKVGLSSVLTGRTASAGFNVSYQFDRFCNAYEGLLKMCQSAGAVLMIERHNGITELWAEQAATITDEADSDLMQFTVTRAHRVVNHLVCAGEGELSERVVVDLYADSSGNISQTQTLSGVDEVALYYNYSGANQADLVNGGTKKLKEYQTNGGAEIGEVGKGDWHVGNVLQVRDNNTGTVVDAIIAKKIVKVERGVLTVDYEIGDHIAAQSASFDADLSGIAETPVPASISRDTANALINELSEGTSSNLNDDVFIITQNTNTSNTNYLRRKLSVLWDYIKSKAAEFFPMLQGATLIPANSDLDSYTSAGTYYATSANAATIANMPYAGAFKMTVERTLNTVTYLKQRFEIYNGANQWVRVSTDGGSTWGDWYREAPHSTQNATANRFLATPNGSAGLPSYRSIVDADLPVPLTPHSHNVKSLITQTTAQAGNFVIDSASLYVSGYTAQLVISFHTAASLTANTEYSIGAIPSSIGTVGRTNANVTDSLWGACLVSNGTCLVRPNANVSASTTARHFQATYILANSYTG